MTVENATTEAPAVESLSAAASTAPETKEVSGLDSIISKRPDQASPATIEKAYSPDFKFKVMGQDKEIDEWVRPIIKDSESEKKIKELYEKAYGLDFIKPKHQDLKTQFDELRQQSQKTEEALQTIGGFVRENDFDSFFDALNIPKQKILEYALDLVKREQMTPEQKSQWEAGRQAREAARYYEAQNQQLMQSQQQLAIQQRTFELDRALESPEVRAIQDAYNAGMGNEAAFKDYVVQIGQAFAARGQDISAAQAVTEAAKHLKAINPSLGASQANLGNVVQSSGKPTIPNLGGRGVSAVKTTVRSLEDLKKKARDLQALDY